MTNIISLKELESLKIKSFESHIVDDGFDIIFENDTRLELYSKDLSWCIEKNEKI